MTTYMNTDKNPKTWGK